MLTIQFDTTKKEEELKAANERQALQYERYAMEARKDAGRSDIERMNKIIEFATRLSDAGINVVLDSWDTTYFTAHVKREDLPAIYKAVGHLSVQGKEVENARRRLLNIYLTAKDFPDYCRVKYQKKLPRGGLTDTGEAVQNGAKCKLVKKISPRKVEYVLECSRD